MLVEVAALLPHQVAQAVQAVLEVVAMVLMAIPVAVLLALPTLVVEVEPVGMDALAAPQVDLELLY